ncbi:concanavalin A-like lectin/glucanase domain-containing protein [Sparassis latifolia]|uniref:Probable glycosidase n=1 Tax=Sparassis crispa TaxID=139825 RepID=A0A401GS63_9APHY|nr:Probable glycosidase [Sparassis crispa]GBE85081.1 Probable glycosidase [Sparassis crispa]
MVPSLLLSVVILLWSCLVHAQYAMVREYVGSTFFNGWNFYNNYDNLTSGNAEFVSASTASKDNLAYVNSAGNAVMRVDNTTTISSFGQDRNSIRISTQDEFTVGSLWITDMVHVPYGCSVWPAFWSSARAWPSGGEIDVFEGVNQVTMNQMALHTATGCSHSSSAVQSSTLVNSTDCSTAVNGNQGCVVTNPTPSSYGADFAQNGGGMFVTEFATDGISIWFFNRSSIPQVLQGNVSTVNTSSLGIPVANWPSSSCDIETFFNPQQLVFDITLCGDYAGNTEVFAETCDGICYDNYVMGTGSNYATAYFEVQYVRVYGLPDKNTVILSSGTRRSTSLRSLAVFASVVGALLSVIFAL